MRGWRGGGGAPSSGLVTGRSFSSVWPDLVFLLELVISYELGLIDFMQGQSIATAQVGQIWADSAR
jgi:hypothetical protein